LVLQTKQDSDEVQEKMTLMFNHRIPIEYFSGDHDTQLKISVNDREIMSRELPKDQTEKITIEFVNNYNEGYKNKITFDWHGGHEHEGKFIKIKNINIHDQILNINNAEYFPELNPEWWESLTQQQQDHYNEIIYGKTGGVFGWYGQINFYFCTGLDFRSRTLYNKGNTSSRKLLSEQTVWIYQDKSIAKIYHKDENDRSI